MSIMTNELLSAGDLVNYINHYKTKEKDPEISTNMARQTTRLIGEVLEALGVTVRERAVLGDFHLGNVLLGASTSGVKRAVIQHFGESHVESDQAETAGHVNDIRLYALAASVGTEYEGILQASNAHVKSLERQGHDAPIREEICNVVGRISEAFQEMHETMSPLAIQ
eukprot:g9518.t1